MKRIKFEDLDAMDSIEFMGINEALKNLKIVINQIAKLASHQ